MLPQAERSAHARQLFSAEDKAREAKKKVWESFVEKPAEEEPTDEVVEETQGTVERKCNFQKVRSRGVHVAQGCPASGNMTNHKYDAIESTW